MILLDANDVVIDIAKEIVKEGKYFRVKKQDDVLYMKDGFRLIDVEAPQQVKSQKYKFQKNEFILNEDYKDPDEIALLAQSKNEVKEPDLDEPEF